MVDVGCGDEDQLGTLTVRVRKARRFCLPADAGGGLIRSQESLMCFKASASPPFRGPAAPVFVEDRFGPASYVVNHVVELCIPSAMNTVGVCEPQPRALPAVDDPASAQ